MLRISKVRKNLNNTRILYDINLNVEKGEIVSIIGASGCGKSTLLKCINGLLKVDNGSIFFEGKNILDKSVDLPKLREKIGIVFQQFNLFPHLTVKENLLLAPLKVKHMSRIEAEFAAMKLLDKVGMLHKLDSYPYQLSGGQSQRVAIARSLIMSPSLMLFDEATSALDPQMTNEVLTVLKQLKKEGMTMIIVTHELDFAAKISNKIVFMQNGTIIETAPTEEFFNSPQHPATIKFIDSMLKVED